MTYCGIHYIHINKEVKHYKSPYLQGFYSANINFDCFFLTSGFSNHPYPGKMHLIFLKHH